MAIEARRTGTARGDEVRAGGAGPMLDAELERVVGARRALEREARRMPWLATTALLALPAGLRWGAGVGLFALAVSMALVLVGTYITWAHRQEYRQSESAIRERRGDVGRAAARAGSNGTPWRVPGKSLVLFERRHPAG